MADDAEEDFTFPATITNPPPCLLESPPLWPSVGKHVQEDEWNFNLCDSLHEFKRNTITFRENFCYVNDDEHKEEKMDILWEDLNEKFSRKNVAEDHLCDSSSSPGKDDHVQVCCVKAFKLSKANGQTISWKKVSILVLIRFLLKKSFPMHDSGASIKKLEW
ncbi:hypothetical protein SASPL_131359 [Salvia splendens]|uniref:Uncharacterized protein n=1 Tax=Salvia splendens TaxID=180675 RepID=A0A4D8Y3Q7_SALSN|nr:uncharacterized protein LOC121754648 [Salvia splendens]XP_042045645.1 uncharacterized protein LOC121791896 [Salvia splendens]KAG6384468.1 hypothetical protein SASPL_155712 [Salvia splendens]KAG6408354.1 hypothetical protein SASPL_131359 [Salvia splendens]